MAHKTWDMWHIDIIYESKRTRKVLHGARMEMVASKYHAELRLLEAERSKCQIPDLLHEIKKCIEQWLKNAGPNTDSSRPSEEV